MHVIAIVLLPGFQKGRDIKTEKGREQFWPKKGNLRRTRKNLKNRISLLLESIKCFPFGFNTFKTL
jgi:hypothetical protein